MEQMNNMKEKISKMVKDGMGKQKQQLLNNQIGCFEMHMKNKDKFIECVTKIRREYKNEQQLVVHKLRFLDDYLQSCNEKQNMESCEENSKNMINSMFVNLKL